MIRYVCKTCGGESPTGIGYAATGAGPLPAPDPACPNPHADVILSAWGDRYGRRFRDVRRAGKRVAQVLYPATGTWVDWTVHAGQVI